MTISRNCPKCGKENYGGLPRCTFCGAEMASPQAHTARAAFCGECGAPIEQALNFCGECGTPVATGKAAPPTRPPEESPWAPRTTERAPGTETPVKPAAQPPAKKKFCRACGSELKPDARFCKKCGKDVSAKPEARPSAPPPAQKAPSAGPGIAKKAIRIIVPVGSMVATYVLTYKVLGPMLIPQFGDAGRQMIPMLTSMAVGGIARQITK
jgi:predicted amidophosphoribosyltransferase